MKIDRSDPNAIRITRACRMSVISGIVSLSLAAVAGVGTFDVLFLRPPEFRIYVFVLGPIVVMALIMGLIGVTGRRGVDVDRDSDTLEEWSRNVFRRYGESHKLSVFDRVGVERYWHFAKQDQAYRFRLVLKGEGARVLLERRLDAEAARVGAEELSSVFGLPVVERKGRSEH